MLFSFDIADLLVFVGLDICCVLDLRRGLFIGEVCFFELGFCGLATLLLALWNCYFAFS